MGIVVFYTVHNEAVAYIDGQRTHWGSEQYVHACLFAEICQLTRSQFVDPSTFSIERWKCLEAVVYLDDLDWDDRIERPPK